MLRDFSALQLKQRFDGRLAVPQDAAQFSPPPIPGTEDVSRGNGSASEFRTDGPAQELVLVKDTDFGHVPRVKPQRHRFPNVCRQRGRKVSQALEVNPIDAHLTRLGHLNQQQVQVVQRVRHPRHEALGFPAFGGRYLRLGTFTTVVNLQQKCPEPGIEVTARL